MSTCKNRGDYNRGYKNTILTKLCMICKCEVSTLREGQILGLRLNEILFDCSHQFPMKNISLRKISLLTSTWIHNAHTINWWLTRVTLVVAFGFLAGSVALRSH